MTELKYTDLFETCRYMGCGDEPDEASLKLASEYAPKLEKMSSPKYIYKAFDMSELEDVLVGEDVRRHVSGCETVLLFAATLGSSADALIRKESALSASGALAADAAASAFIEGFCRSADEEIAESFEGKSLTWRYAPGYGDMPLSVQKEILSRLDAERKLGITLTESYIMLPRKSVTAVIGVSDEKIEKGRRSCAICNMAHKCAFRKKGVICGL